MHRLVPDFILENLQLNRLKGSFSGSAIFVDISGFTPLTESLMSHGQHGAEVLANVMRLIFTPLVQAVFNHEGFITNFAGDAFTAVFPSDEDDLIEPSLNALTVAWQIQDQITKNARQATRYGSFDFSVKVGMACGETFWGILKSQDDEQAAYYFKGTAIDGCAAAEKLAKAGDIIASEAVYDTVSLRVSAKRVDDHWRIDQIMTTLPDPVPARMLPLNVEKMALFNPRILFEQKISGEFRQVINLFIQLQGDPGHEELADFMQHLFALKKQYGGMLNRIDFGDKGCHLLLFWGAPFSYENDVTRALEFVLDLRRLSEIPLRVGITYHIAHAGCIGSSLAEEYTCYGRGINLAARFMVAAEWHEIWIDHETAQRAETTFHLRPLGLKEFKGISEAQPVYRLDGWREQMLSPFGTHPIVGREQEIRKLRKAIEPIYKGRFAGVMTVCGDAGIGKSRLVHTFLDQRVRKQTAVIICQTDEILRQSLNPFRYFLQRYFDQSANVDEMANKNRFSQILTRLLRALPDEELKTHLQRGESFLGNLLGLHWSDSLYEQLEPELRFENTLDALKALIKAESLLHPLIILLEDAHWLDDDSIHFLARLTRNVAEFPFAILITSRDEMPPEYFDPQAAQSSIRLQALDTEHVTQLVAAELDHLPSASLVKLINERTDGNPFYVQQMLLYLRENELLERVDKLVDSTLPGDVYVPTDVRNLLTSRLDRLPLSLKDVVQKAAVLGREFELPILQRMVDPETQLSQVLQSGSNEGVWFALDEGHYLFRHALLRDAAYDMQLQSRRRELHRSAAQAFEERYQQDPDLNPPFAQMAYHFDRAEDAEQARGYYGEAGELAKEEYHNEEAISYYSRALELTEDDQVESKYRFLCDRETIYQWQGRREEQKNDLAQIAVVLEKHPNNMKSADLALRQSSFALVTGDYETAVALAQKSLEFAKKTQDIKAMAKAYHRLGRTLWQQGRAQEAENPLKKALLLAERSGLREIEAVCHYDLNVVYQEQVDYQRMEAHLNLALKAYEELDDKEGLARCKNGLGILSYVQADFSNAISHYEEALKILREIGWRYVEPRSLTNIGNVHFDLGNYELAKTYHEQSMEICHEINNFEIQAISLDTLGLIAHYVGNTKEAVRLYNEAMEILEKIDNKGAAGYTLTHLGFVLIDLGEFAKADDVLNESLEIRKKLGAEALLIDTMAGLARLHLMQGNKRDATDLVTKILAWIKDNGTNGIELPLLVYLICYQVLASIDPKNSVLMQKAVLILEKGYKDLERQALRIKDPKLRRAFLENVPYNRSLQSAWEENRAKLENK